MRGSRVVMTVLVAAAVVMGACGGGDEGGSSAQDVAAGSALFAQHCASCHGAEGVGGTGPVLKEKRFLEEATEERLVNQIAVGIPRTQMPAWSKDNGGPLTDGQITQIAAYLKSLEADAPVVENRRQPRTP